MPEHQSYYDQASRVWENTTSHRARDKRVSVLEDARNQAGP